MNLGQTKRAIEERNNRMAKGALYDNCKVYSMENKLMFRCNKKRINWYITRGLAEKIEDSEGTEAIRLKFKPKGEGSVQELADSPAINKCVCCGSEDLSILTKHHIVPREFRTLFPIHMKNRFGFLIVPMCVHCHVKYEREHAKALRRQLHDKSSYLVSKESEKIQNMINFMADCKLYVESGINLSDKEIKAIESMANEIDCTVELNRLNDEYYIRECISFLREINREERNKLDLEKKKLFIKTDKEIEDFCRMWVNDFLDNAKPQFLPAYFSMDVLNKVFENIQEKLKERQLV